MRAPVFLSASEPYHWRDPEYWETQHLVNIRAAVRALCAHVLPRWPLVYGGHPAITPLVNGIAGRVMHDRNRDREERAPPPQTLMFQSAHWPVREEPGAVVTPAVAGAGDLSDRDASLLLMRYVMLDSPQAAWRGRVAARRDEFRHRRAEFFGTESFTAGVFIGGMEGVECEFNIFRSFHPDTPAYVLPSTGAAARKLRGVLERQPPQLRRLLETETAYAGLFQLVLPVDGEPERGLTWRPAPPTDAERSRHSDQDVRSRDG